MSKKRSSNAATERAGILAMASACNSLGLIWRDLLQEDVGVDATIELCVDGLPTGKLVGVQVKSGTSYIRSETEENFRFYPSADDLNYWRRLTIPLILVVFDPSCRDLYWLDIQRYMEARPENPLGQSYLLFSKTQKVNGEFEAYLRSRFDLVVYTDDDFAAIRAEFEALTYRDEGVPGHSATVTGLDLFIGGLWGLCSKLQWHLSLLTQAIRIQLSEQSTPSMVTYDLSRAKLFPLLTGYFSLLGSRHLAKLDYDDLNHTLYSKLEWPTFIAPLTLNGRRFVEYLRRQLTGDRQVCDQNFFSLELRPHSQIEVYSSFDSATPQPFGPYTDVFVIRLNRYLDYYYLLHLTRPLGESKPEVKAAQTMFYYELRDYLEAVLDGVPKDNILGRHQDMAISPLICWLERYLEMETGFTPEDLAQKPPSEILDFQDEMATIFSPGSESMIVRLEPVPDLRFARLASGEPLVEPSE
ncbi:MAG: DUF4365 domain-containing protein [Thermoanaerobaculia bacterium]